MIKFCSAILLFTLLTITNVTAQQISLPERIDNLILDSKFQEAVNLADANLKQIKDDKTALTIQNKKADALIRMGKFQEATELLEKLEAGFANKPATLEQAVTRCNLGFLRLNMGRTDDAEDALRNAINLFNQIGQPACLDAARALSNLGLVYINTGQYSLAEEQLQMALSLRQKLLPASHELIAATYNDLGLAYSQIDKEKALDYYEKALATYKKLHGEEHLKIAQASINTGVVYRDLELYGDAVTNFETALKIFEKVYTQPHSSKAIALYNLGQTYSNMGNKGAAMEYYQRALTMYENSFGKKHPEVAYVYNSMGNIHLSEGRYDEALIMYQHALIANVADFDSDNLSDNPKLENFYMGIRLLQSLVFKAEAFESRYYGHTIKFSDLEEALAILNKCDALIDILRQQSNNENDKILLGIVANEVYADGVRVAYTAGANAFKKSMYYEKAFYFAEKSKSAVLLDAISESNAKSFAGIPDPLLNEERELKSEIALCAQKLAQRPGAEEEKMWREKLFALNRNYEAFTTKLETEFPNYFNLKFNKTLPSINEIQQVLDNQTTLVSYFIDDSNKRLYIFEISKGKFKIEDVLIPDVFEKSITGLRNSLFYNDARTFVHSSHLLGKTLLPKNLIRKSGKLIIIPTGRLGIIPFEALLIKPTEENQSYATMPYLIRSHSIRYEFSASLLLQKAKNTKEGAPTTPSIMLCAPITFPQKDHLSDLPGTESEVKEISGLFQLKNLSNKLFTGADANEGLLKSGSLKDFNYLHLATHGVVDEARPELSRIFLHTSGSEDGDLFTGEIYNLQLNADLVTLSACQTGLGKVSKGEGVIGLSRALVYAGAKNIIVSYWSVADESTSMLMKDFYDSMLGKAGGKIDLSQSLQQAKLKMLKKKEYSAPYYWAPFVLIGF